MWRPQDSHFPLPDTDRFSPRDLDALLWKYPLPLGSVPPARVPPVLAEDADPQRLRHEDSPLTEESQKRAVTGCRPGPPLFSAAPFARLTAHAVLKVTRWLLTLAIASASSQEEGRRRGGKWALFSFLSSFKKPFWFSPPNPSI